MKQRRTDRALPFAEKKFIEIKGHRIAYIDEGRGAPLVCLRRRCMWVVGKDCVTIRSRLLIE